MNARNFMTNDVVSFKAGVKMLFSLLLVNAIVAARPASASDAVNGKLIAVSRCAPCHAVEHDGRRNEIAESPPFDVISTKFDSNQTALVEFILAPHAKMNMRISRREGEDIAAYIAALGK